MANIKSQKKRILTNNKRHERNKAATDSIGTDANDEDVRVAMKRIDSAVSKGVIHKNTAARKKSRLMQKVNSPA